ARVDGRSIFLDAGTRPFPGRWRTESGLPGSKHPQPRSRSSVLADAGPHAPHHPYLSSLESRYPRAMKSSSRSIPPLEKVLDTPSAADDVRIEGVGPEGSLPLTPERLRSESSGNLFGLTQNAGMGWNPRELGRPEYLIVSTQGGLRDE